MLFEDCGISKHRTFAQFQFRVSTVERVAKPPSVNCVAADPISWVQFVSVATKRFVEGLQESRDFGFIQTDDGMQFP